ncbi:amidase [Roseomonas nepalensis]|uniref:Amidase n=1 Tax=Muricoccus nepalensis TaxID=1854500 RepID=A0A502GFH0_9PROT|nr:amidase [Roseomonas nepalensis]TPG60501.1 amidase [Roseomonas nepalensis]
MPRPGARPGPPPGLVLAWRPPRRECRAIDPSTLSAGALVGLYRRGALSPVEAARAALGRIARGNPRLNAVIALDEAGARAAAARSEARWRAGCPAGPLDGVPLTVKDNIPAAGLPCRWGSPAWPGGVPARDELPVARLRAGGAVILGKTNVPEFTLEGYTDNALFGPTRNPWDPRLTPGGSSGGAVAAVASGMGPLALGTDGGGSIRRPASHTGLVGLKPTPGRVPRAEGLPAILLDLEVIGPIARTVADAALLLAAIADPAPEDPLSRGIEPFAALDAAPRLRIRYVPRFGASPVDPGIATSVAVAAGRLAALGHAVEEGPPPFDPDAVLPLFPAIAGAGLAWLLGSLPGHPSPSSPALAAMAAAGRGAGAAALFGALDAMGAFRQAMALFLTRDCDAILTPAAAALPWPARESHPPVIDGQPAGPRGHAVFTNFANLGALPAIALPGDPVAGLPAGFQLVGAPGSEAALLAVGAAYEAAHPWADRWPDLA